MRNIMLPLAGACAALLLACEPPAGDADPGPAELGRLEANLVVPEEDDVAAIRLEVFAVGGGRVAERTITPGEQRLPGAAADAPPMRGGDVLLALRPGAYRAVATPLDVDGNPSEQCAPAEDEADVALGRTTEIVLLMPCGDDGTGALDVVLGLVHPPVITDVRVEPSKFIETCQTAVLRAPARDADGDPLSWSWRISAGNENNVAVLNGQGASARFATAAAGDYEVEVVVKDPSGATARLAVPVHVAQGGDDPDCLGNDQDGDGWPDLVDNCPPIPDPTQADRDGDGVGDVCVDGPNAPLFLDFVVDQQLRPAVADLAGPNDLAPRPVARAIDRDGNAADFVADELLVALDDESRLPALLDRWGGEVTGEITVPGAQGAVAPMFYRVRIDTGLADPAQLPALVRGLDPLARGVVRVSSPQALGLMAAAAAEATDGVTVGLNVLLEGDDIGRGFTTEAPAGAGPWNDDAFQWPYLSRDSAQDFGVAAAWRALDTAGRLVPGSVPFAVVDGGFTNHADLPAGARLFGAAFGTPNAYSCTGGAPCPWHGTQVAAAGMGVPDNGFGAAGPAGPVARPILVQTPRPDFFEYLRFIFDTVPAALGERPAIVNISASADIPAGACAFACPFLHLATRVIRSSGLLVVSSAGNTNTDLDSEDCFIFCWEGATTVPCELNDVLCVGGLDWDSTNKHPSSSYGRNATDSVDLFGPFTMWTVTPNADGSGPPNNATLSSGTSFSSPFVAGCAALVWAANPSLSANQVERLLLRHARPGGFRVTRIANCYDAVIDALGGDAPPTLTILSPHDGAEYVRGRVHVEMAALAEDDEDGVPSVEWFSDRDGRIGSGRSTRRNDLSLGEHLITAVVRDSYGWTVSDSVRITVRAEAPQVTILNPLEGARIGALTDLRLDGSSVYFGRPPRTALPDDALTWHLDGGGVFARGPSARVPGGTLAPGRHTIELRGTIDGFVVTDRVTIEVEAAGEDRAPSVVEIIRPVVRDQLLYADRADDRGLYVLMELRGRAQDPEDGDLTGAALRWTATVEGRPGVIDLGGTERTVARLHLLEGDSVTVYRVTLTATDSGGNSSTDTVIVRVTTLF